MRSLTVGALVDKFLSFVSSTASAGTLALARAQLGKFRRTFAYEIAAKLTPAKIREWGRTYHRVEAVKRMTRWATHEARLLAADPLAGMKRLPRGRRVRVLTPVEGVRLLRRARGRFRQFLVALAETIARPAELRSVCWHHVRVAGLQPFELDDLAAGRAFFFLETFKALERNADRHAVRVIPITPRLGRLLARLWRAGPELDARIFVNRYGRPWTVNAVRLAFRRLRDRAGIAADYRGENVVAYTFRHTGATAAIVAGVELGALAGAMGHTDVRMTSRYVHLSPTFLKQVIERVQAAKWAGRRKNDRLGLRRTRPDASR